MHQTTTAVEKPIVSLALANGETLIAEVSRHSDGNFLAYNALMMVMYPTSHGTMDFNMAEYMPFAERPITIYSSQVVAVANVDESIAKSFRESTESMKRARKRAAEQIFSTDDDDDDGAGEEESKGGLAVLSPGAFLIQGNNTKN